MSAHVWLNLLNELRIRDKMWSLSNMLSLFCNKFKKINKTGARILDQINQDIWNKDYVESRSALKQL